MAAALGLANPMFHDLFHSILRSPEPPTDSVTPTSTDTTAPSAAHLMRLQQAALQHAANAVIITDVRGVILWTNPAFTVLTGYPASEAVGQTPALLKSGKQDGSHYDGLWRAITAGQTWRGEFTNRRKNGTI